MKHHWKSISTCEIRDASLATETFATNLTTHLVQAVGIRSDGKAFYSNIRVANSQDTPAGWQQARDRAIEQLNQFGKVSA